MLYWHKDRYIDEWSRIESLQVNPQIYEKMILDKSAKTVL